MPAQTAPTLHAETRTILGKKVSQLRSKGFVPVVLYGQKHAPQHLSIVAKDFDSVFASSGTTTLVNIVIDKQQPLKVLIHDVQLQPSKRTIVHADLYQVNLKEKVRTAIPLEFEGTADAVEVEGGSLQTIKDELDAECLPENLVPHITVDISVLKTFDDVIRVSDLVIPQGIEIHDEPDAMIAQVIPPRSEAELEELDEVVDASVAHVEVETEDGTVPAATDENTDEKK